MPIKRPYFERLWGQAKDPRISILLGARQVGKSTLMRQLETEAKQNGQPTIFFDLEQPSDLEMLAGSSAQIIRRLSEGPRYVFIDEFHYLKNASKIFKAVYDSRLPIKIFASGSSSLEIHKHLKESLAGRFLRSIIFPMTVREWRGVPAFEEEDYTVWGGLPGLIHQKTDEDRLALLDNILSTYITKDIKGLIKEENIRAFNSLLHLLAQSQGQLIVASALARETGLSESTVARHLEVMKQTYVLHDLPSYSTNLANELKKSKKYYFFDPGIRNALIKDFRPAEGREDRGVLYETAVMLHLLTQLKPNMELRFWRTKKGEEVDFVLVKNRIPVPVEVKSRLHAEIPAGILNFLKRYPRAPFALVFSRSAEQTREAAGRPVYFKNWTASAELDYLKSVR